MAEQLDTAKFYFVGNNLSVDFINTQILEDGAPKELLESFADFVAWAAAANLVSDAQAAALIKTWRGKPQAGQSFQEAIAFRETLRKLLQKTAQGAEIEASAISAIN